MDKREGNFDIAVIGAGIAGASVAAELACSARVILIERESQPGYHTTGRSAALYSCTYGPPVIRGLSRASGPFFFNPPSKFCPHPLLTPRGVLFIARPDQADTVTKLKNELGSAIEHLSAEKAKSLLPMLRGEYLAQALFEEHSYDIDVDGLHQLYLRTLKDLGGKLSTDTEVLGLEKTDGDWLINTSKGEVRAEIVVNASGAWADQIAQLGGVAPVGLVPKRRTAMIVSPAEGMEPEQWPMAVDIDEQFYMKPDGGKLLISPADETPSEPCDAQAEDLDVAICVDRIEKAFDVSVRRIEHKWAGLRNFVADKCPVAGFDPDVEGFFWLAGQGGYGIQSAPALSRTAAALVLGKEIPSDIQDEGVTVNALSRTRVGLKS